MILIMAWRNIWRNKLRSLVIILSVALGLFAGLMVLSIYKGMLRGRVRTVIDSEVGHIQIHDSNFKKDYDPFYIIKEPGELIKALNKNQDIKSFSVRSITQGMLSATTGSAGVQINGVLPLEENIVSQLAKKIKIGNGFTDHKKNEILIGKKLAKKLKLKLGGKIVLTITDTSAEIVSGAYRIASIFESENAPLDETNVYVKKEALDEMLGTTNQIHEIAIRLNKDELLGATVQQIQKQFKQYQIDTWEALSPETVLMVDTIDITSYIIIGIILFALAFGIINTMLMAILERTKEIGMMMALGLNKIKLFQLILLETIFLTTIGTPLGLGMALSLTNYYHQNGLHWESMSKELMSSFGFSTTIYPEFPIEKTGISMCFVVLTAILSCIYPAIKALQLQPVDALRK